jgi:hypothetical protein
MNWCNFFSLILLNDGLLDLLSYMSWCDHIGTMH